MKNVKLSAHRMDMMIKNIYGVDTVHFDGTPWKYKTSNRLRLLLSVIQWAMSDQGGQVSRDAWQKGNVLTFYLFYDDMNCVENNGRWPGQIRYLTFTKEQEYLSEQVLPQQINFII